MTHQTLVTCNGQTAASVWSYNPYNPKLRSAIIVIVLINLDSRAFRVVCSGASVSWECQLRLAV